MNQSVFYWDLSAFNCINWFFFILFVIWKQHRWSREEGERGRGLEAGLASTLSASTKQPEREALLWRGARAKTGRTQWTAGCSGPRELVDSLRKHHVPWQPSPLGLTGSLPPRQTSNRQTTWRWGRKGAWEKLQDIKEVGRQMEQRRWDKEREQVGLGDREGELGQPGWAGTWGGKGERVGLGKENRC